MSFGKLLFAGCLAAITTLSADNFVGKREKFNRLFQKDVHLTEILFQAFTWDAAVNGQKHIWYRHIQKKVDDLADNGITHVWYPPVSRSVSSQGYMPGDYYDLGEGEELGHNRTLYGNKKELLESLKAFRKKDIKTIADIVINHRCGSHQEDGQWNVFHHKSGKMIWEKWALARGDYGGTGNPDTGGDFGAAADIDHTNKQVQGDLIRYMNWLRNDIGFDGFRFDYSKGYDGFFTKMYVAHTNPVFSVGEYWTSMSYGKELLPDQDAHRKQLVNWIDRTEGTVMAFDFTTKGLLQEACKNDQFWRLKDREGRAGGVIGWWPQMAVTFVDNHDTGSTQAHWPFPADKVLAGYAYILTHPGVPTVFWDHFYQWGDFTHNKIAELCALRHEMGIHKASELIIHVADQGLYAAEIGNRVMVKLGSNHWAPDPCWKIKLVGPGYKIWTREQ